MKKTILSIAVLFTLSIAFAQKSNSDSIEQLKKIEIVRENVQTFFKKQHKRFSYQLKGLNQEYAVYFTPTYGFRGRLDFWDYSIKGVNLVNITSKDIESPLKFYKPTSFEKPLNAPQKVIDYFEMLLKRTSNNWCEERFGYKNLEYGDDFGILLILSPKEIPDSLSALKVTWYSPSDYETASENKKRMMDLFVKLGEYYFMGEGLRERFISIVLKY